MNRPQRDTALIQEAGISLDRALFPLLMGIQRHGPIGVVELARLAGRDYTTVSRQVTKLESLWARRTSCPQDRQARPRGGYHRQGPHHGGCPGPGSRKAGRGGARKLEQKGPA